MILTLLPQLLLMLFLLILSGCFSGSETAIFSLSAADLNQIRKQNSWTGQRLLQLHAELGDFLMTVLFCNMMVNILFFATSTTVGAAIADKYGHQWMVPFGLLCLLLVITFGEVTPKTLATTAAPFFARMASVPMLTLHRGLWWVRSVLGRFVLLAERIAGVQPKSSNVDPEELRLLISMSRTDGIISTDEHALIAEVLELPSVRVRDVMTHRVDVISARENESAATILLRARETGHSKMPVRCADSDEYIGWLDARDLLHREGEFDIRSVMRRTAYLSELDRLDQALEHFRQSGDRLMVVVDERGAGEGILTMTNIMSQIFGHIAHEDSHPADDPISQDGENCYRLDGGLSIREWRSHFGIAEDLPSVATLGGLVTALLGRTPHLGDTVHLRNLSFEITRMSGRRILEVCLTLLPPPATGEDEPC